MTVERRILGPSARPHPVHTGEGGHSEAGPSSKHRTPWAHPRTDSLSFRMVTSEACWPYIPEASVGTWGPFLSVLQPQRTKFPRNTRAVLGASSPGRQNVKMGRNAPGNG